MAPFPLSEYDTRPTRISTPWLATTDTRTFTITISSSGLISATGCFENWEIPKSEIIETKKEKLDRISKTKMLASHKIYNQKDMHVIKIKHMSKPQHRISNGAFRGLR